MSKQEVEALSTDQLKSKSNKARLILGILIGAAAVNMVVVFLLISMGKSDRISAVASPTIGALFFIQIIYSGKKKVEEELRRRENQ